MQRILFFICLLASIATNAANIADSSNIANVVQVEVIFFEHTDPNRFTAEDWPKYVGKLDTKGAVQLNKLQRGVPESIDTLEILNNLELVDDEPIAEVIQASVNLVEPKQRLLNKQADILKKSKVSRLIEHKAWMQPMAWNVQATPIHLQGGKDKQKINTIVWVKPAKGMYQVHIDLIFNATDEDGHNKSGVTEFRITKDLKLKKNEIYYIDHPIIGAIIMVSPVVEEY